MDKAKKKKYYHNWIVNRNIRCIDCSSLIRPGGKRCIKCYRVYSKKLLGKDHFNFIKGKPKCDNCGKQLSSYNFKKCVLCANREISKRPEYREKQRLLNTGKNNPFYGKKHTEKSKKLMSLGNLGPLGPLWIDGRSYIKYPREYFVIRDTILERDNYICKICGYKHIKGKRDIHVHHIDSNKLNNKEYNLITLCKNCHLKKDFSSQRKALVI